MLSVSNVKSLNFPRWLTATFFVLGAVSCSSGDSAAKVDTSGAAAASAVTTTRVNNGPSGMSARVRWLLSPDKSAIIVVVDPVGVEAEPVPNAFFFGSESANFQARMDSVWDVAISPDWKSIAYGRAFIARGNESDTAVAPSAWNEIARATGIDTATLRTSSFSASGMSYIRSVAVPGVIEVGKGAVTTNGIPGKLFPIPRGWRIRWTGDSKTIGLSSNPARALDDEFPQTWAALDPVTGAFNTTLPATSRLEQPKWTEGPALDASVKPDITHAPLIFVKAGETNYTIESERGVITMRASDQKAPVLVIGPGIALAATVGGRYVVALAPRTDAAAGEVPFQVVVYSVSR